MNKFNRFALMSAIALTGAAGFTACSSEDELTNTNPTFDGESVKTQFAINIPRAGKSTTRMGQDVVQGQTTPIFRGMSDIQLIPIKVGTTPSDAGNPVEGTNTFLANAIKLPNITGGNDGDANGELIDNSNSKLYTDVDVPVETNAFLFYGKATDKAAGTLSADQVNGALLPSYVTSGLTEGAQVNTIHFDLKEIMSAQTSDETQKKALIDLLTAVGNAEVNSTKFISLTDGAEGSMEYYADKFKELKAGSANSIRLALQDLYNAMDASSPVSEDSYTGMKAAIQSAILGASNANFTKSGTYPNITLAYADGFAGKDYPRDIDLPDGAVQVDYASDAWTYVTKLGDDPSTDNTGLNVASLEKYAYPASLYYWVNTSISTSSQSQASEYNETNKWAAILGKYTDGKVVASTTRSIAMDKEINYAVSRLDVKAAFTNNAITDNDNENVTMPTEGFKLTGVLIGGQKQVNWNFQTNVEKQQADEMTIYDADIKTSANGDVYVKRGTQELVSQTLVLETEAGTADQAKTVNFALEFENNSTDEFQGHDGIVPVGGKFYLVGTLSSETTADKKGDEPILKVFEQDKYTTANVTISSLKNAYNCVPDLRTPGLELGLSVDLTWTAGLVDDVEIK